MHSLAGEEVGVPNADDWKERLALCSQMEDVGWKHLRPGRMKRDEINRSRRLRHADI
jgi:hypothetical protein